MIMLQILILIIILLIGGYVFYKYPLKADVKDMCMSALFIVLAILLKRLAIMVPLFGFPSLEVGFQGLSLIVAGMLLKPGYAFLIGLSVDIIGLLLFPSGVPFLGFTLNAILRPLIPSLWMANAKNTDKQITTKKLYLLLAIMALTAVGYVFSLNTITISSQSYDITILIKIGIFALCFMVVLGLIIMCELFKKKLTVHSSNDLIRWMAVVILLEVTINFLLTPLWLQTMYGIPWIASLLVRILKAIVMVPLYILIGYTCYEMLKKVLK